MGRTKTPGLRKRNGTWHIEKQIKGYGRLFESTGSSSLAEAEFYLARRLEEIRKTTVYGTRPIHLFCEAADKYLKENEHKASIKDDERHLEQLDPFVGQVPLHRVHIGHIRSVYLTSSESGR